MQPYLRRAWSGAGLREPSEGAGAYPGAYPSRRALRWGLWGSREAVPGGGCAGHHVTDLMAVDRPGDVSVGVAHHIRDLLDGDALAGHHTDAGVPIASAARDICRSFL